MLIKFRAATGRSPILLFVLIFEVWSFSGVSADKLVGLNGDSQNSRYVEIRRSPGNRRPIDVPSIDSMPKAHGLQQLGDNDEQQQSQIRRSPQSSSAQQPQQQQQQQQSTNGFGFSSPFASMMNIPGMPSLGSNNMNNLFQFPMHQNPTFNPQQQYNQASNNPLQHPSIPLSHQQHPLMHLSQLPSPHSSPAQYAPPAQASGTPTATLSPLPQQTPIPTLSATLHPAFTLLPTLPTISFPTFPPFTMPPAFDQMASGFTKKSKRRHKSRRKAPKKVYSSENDDVEESEKPIKKRPKKTHLEKVESRLPKYANEEISTGDNVESKGEKWMVPYYGNNKLKQKS